MNNQGQVIQITLILIALFIIGFFIMFGSYIVSQFNTAIAGDFSTDAKDMVSNSEYAWTFADTIYPVTVVLLMIAMVVTYLYIPTHPVLLFIEFIMFVFAVFTGGVIGNVNENLFNSTEFNATASNLPMITLINNNLGFIAVLFGVITLLVLFIRRGDQ